MLIRESSEGRTLYLSFVLPSLVASVSTHIPLEINHVVAEGKLPYRALYSEEIPISVRDHDLPLSVEYSTPLTVFAATKSAQPPTSAKELSPYALADFGVLRQSYPVRKG